MVYFLYIEDTNFSIILLSIFLKHLKFKRQKAFVCSDFGISGWGILFACMLCNLYEYLKSILILLHLKLLKYLK
jgi:hypothetical protein